MLRLAKAGCIVRGFRSADAFLAQVDELDPGVVVLNLHIPAEDGVDVLQAIRAQGSRFVAIVIGAECTVRAAVQAMKAEAFDVLETPCEPDALVGAIDAALQRLERNRAASAHTEAATATLAKLSMREREVLKGLIDGRPNKQIAFELSLSPRTVEIYRANLMDKLQVRSLSEALRIAFTAGLFPAV
ncbi:response regulator transcription factor [Sphingomonas sp. ac-8]|uniref:response regulator transcription factor n=1 Tax=Sphingomonas sp. ac-8 TaxID=3242977 RepID=UPI003A809E3D